MKKFCTVILLVVCACAAISGCWAPKPPETSFGVNPWTHSWEFKDTKDNDVVVKNAKYNAATKEASVESIEIHNSASQVMKEQKELMAQWNIQMQTANEGITRVMAGLDALASRLTAPFLGANLNMSGQGPIGSAQGNLQLGTGQQAPPPPSVAQPPASSQPTGGGGAIGPPVPHEDGEQQ